MRLTPLALLATLLLAAPASAARFQHNGADIDFTVGADRRRPRHRHRLRARRPDAAHVHAWPGRLALHGRLRLLAPSFVARCGVTDDTRLRFTTNDRPDVIDAPRTDTPEDASVPQIFDTKGGADVLSAGPRADEVRAGTGNDTITGGPGADSLLGEDG